MDFEILSKGDTLVLDIASKKEDNKVFYFGAGWDNPNGPIDLDIVCVSLIGSKLTDQSNLVYFGNKTSPGIVLSEDNTTGEGDGDDESIVINTGALPADVDSVVIGLASYGGGDLKSAPNAHFRICDGDNESADQIGDIQVGDASDGDTVLVAAQLNRTDDGWTVENVADFHALGSRGNAIEGFARLYAA